MKNFKSNVPVGLQLKVAALAQEIENNFRSLITQRIETVSDVRMNEIEGNYVSGWMPRQDGGFSVEQFIQSDIDSSYHLTEKQTESVNAQSKACWEMFIHDSDLPIDFTSADLSEEEQEEFCNYEREWQDDALLQFQVFVDGYGEFSTAPEKTVTLRVSVNYKDAPYYRESSAEDIKVIILSIDEFTNTEIADILKQITI